MLCGSLGIGTGGKIRVLSVRVKWGQKKKLTLLGPANQMSKFPGLNSLFLGILEPKRVKTVG
jgi:hypothetical protein